MSRIRWTERAVTDLLAIGDFIATDKPAAARAWVERLRTRVDKAARTPLAARVVPELGRDDIREVFVRSYRIVHQVVPKGIVVLTVFEGHRLFGNLDLDPDE